MSQGPGGTGAGQAPARRAASYTFRLADVLFLLAHDEQDLPRLRPAVQELVLAAGLLAELVLKEKVDLHEGGLYAISRDEPDEPLSARVYSQILDFTGGELTVWLRSLARTANSDVTDRLVRARVLESVPAPRRRRRWSRAGPTHAVRARHQAELSWLVLVNRLHRRDVLTTADAFVVGVSMAAGLDTYLFQGAPPAARGYAERVVAALPDALGQLVVQVDGLIGSDVLLYK